MMTALWATMLAEPRWLVIVGLGFDAIGAVLVAWIAWARIAMPTTIDEIAPPGDPTLRLRCRMVVCGGALLVTGFGLQAIAAMMQMGQGHPGYWTI